MFYSPFLDSLNQLSFSSGIYGHGQRKIPCTEQFKIKIQKSKAKVTVALFYWYCLTQHIGWFSQAYNRWSFLSFCCWLCLDGIFQKATRMDHICSSSFSFVPSSHFKRVGERKEKLELQGIQLLFACCFIPKWMDFDGLQRYI